MGSRQRPGGVEAKAWRGRGKGLVGSRQRPVRPPFLAVKASMRFLVVFVCSAVHLETSKNMHSALLLTKYAFKDSNLFQG